jgi:hypothetical protein
MIKNIILSFLAICFLFLIITYILNLNQLKLWNIREGNANMSIQSKIETETNITRQQLSAINETLDLDNDVGVLKENIVKVLGNLNVSDSEYVNILKDTNIKDKDKIIKIKARLEILKKKQVARGLVIHYTLDTIESDGTIPNVASTGSEYNGQKNGTLIIDKATYKTGNGSMRFNYNNSDRFNTRDFISIPSIPSFYDKDGFQGFSYAVWYKSTRNSNIWGRLFEFAVNKWANHTILATVNWGSEMKNLFMFVGPNPYEFNAILAQTEIPVDTWHHAAGTISKDGSVQCYLNGVKQASQYARGKDVNVVSSWEWWNDPDINALKVPGEAERKMNYIGKSVWWEGDSGYDGWMNDFRIYNKALDAEEVKDIFNLQVRPKKYDFAYLSIHIDSKKENVTLTEGGKIQYIKDLTGNNNWATLEGALVEYCPRKEVIYIPPSQYILIKNRDKNGRAISLLGENQFTVALVMNVKNFNSQIHKKVNYTVCSLNWYNFEMYFHNNQLRCGSSGRAATVLYDMDRMIPPIKGDSKIIIVIKVNSANDIYCSINGSNPVVTNMGKPWIFNDTITIGRCLDYHWSSDTLEFYEFMVFNEFCELEKQRNIEMYLNEKWNLNVLPIKS